MSLIVAIDGPAGAGKSTLANRLAAHFDLYFLDTGLLYRAVARRIADRGAAADDENAAIGAAETLALADLDVNRLYGEGIGNRASIVAALPALREALLPVQRRLASQGAAQGNGSVVAGRDIGSVVLPDCPVKFFVTASIEERAVRRLKDLQGRGEAPTREQVLADLIERDRRDENRAAAPLVIPQDAIVIDSSLLDEEQVFEQMRQAVDAKRAELLQP